MHDSSLLLFELGAIILGLGLLGAVSVRFGFSPIPLYLLAGLAFGQGGLVPLATSEDFISAGAEIGVILHAHTGCRHLGRLYLSSTVAATSLGFAFAVSAPSRALRRGVLSRIDARNVRPKAGR